MTKGSAGWVYGSTKELHELRLRPVVSQFEFASDGLISDYTFGDADVRIGDVKTVLCNVL